MLLPSSQNKIIYFDKFLIGFDKLRLYMVLYEQTGTFFSFKTEQRYVHKKLNFALNCV